MPTRKATVTWVRVVADNEIAGLRLRRRSRAGWETPDRPWRWLRAAYLRRADTAPAERPRSGLRRRAGQEYS